MAAGGSHAGSCSTRGNQLLFCVAVAQPRNEPIWGNAQNVLGLSASDQGPGDNQQESGLNLARGQAKP